MARRKSAEELRAVAAQMLKQAKLVEEQENALLGKFIRDIATGGYKPTYDELKKHLEDQFGIVNPHVKPMQSNSNKPTEQKSSNEVK